MKPNLKVSIFFRITISIAALFLAQSTQAVMVPPGGSVLLGGTTFATNPDLGGVVLKDDLLPFEIKDNLGNVILVGMLQDRVVRSDNTGQLIFAPRLRDLKNPNGDGWILSLRLEGYGNFATDIDFRTDGLGDVGPNEVTRSTGSGDQLSFRYDPNIIVPPSEALFLSILTDAPAFCMNGKITIFAQNDFGASVFSTTLENTASPDLKGTPESCNGGVQSCIATVGLNLDIHVPSADYQTLGGTTNIWFNLEFKGVDSDNDFIWKLKDFGEN